MPSARNATGHYEAREGGERGSPESEDLPVAAKTTEPLAEGRIRVKAPTRRPPRASPARGLRLVGEPAAARHLVVCYSNRIVVRNRRREAGDRRRRPVRLSRQRAEDQALRLPPERRGDRRLQARPRRARLRPERA